MPKSNLQWSELLKARRNPFIAPSNQHEMVSNFSYGMASSMAAAGFNILVTDRLPSHWHIPVRGMLAAGSTMLPKHPASAALGGALFYSLLSETYYAFIKNSLLTEAQSALSK